MINRKIVKFIQTSYAENIILHHPPGGTPGPVECEHCNLKVNSPYDLHQHIANGECELLRCSLCDDYFFKKSDLKRHLEDEHDSDQEPEELDDKPFCCPICSKCFSTKSLLSGHKKIHVPKDSQNYVCEICDKEFALKKYLNKHLKRHNEQHSKIANAGLSKFLFF